MQTILNPYVSVHYLYILTVAIVVIAFLLSIAVFSTRRKFTKKNITRSRFFFASHVLFLCTVPQILFWLYFGSLFFVYGIDDRGASSQIIFGIYAWLIVFAIPELLLKLLAIIMSLVLYGPFIQKFYTKSVSDPGTVAPTRGEYIKLLISLLFLVLPFILWVTVVDWEILYQR